MSAELTTLERELLECLQRIVAHFPQRQMLIPYIAAARAVIAKAEAQERAASKPGGEP